MALFLVFLWWYSRDKGLFAFCSFTLVFNSFFVTIRICRFSLYFLRCLWFFRYQIQISIFSCRFKNMKKDSERALWLIILSLLRMIMCSLLLRRKRKVSQKLYTKNILIITKFFLLKNDEHMILWSFLRWSREKMLFLL